MDSLNEFFYVKLGWTWVFEYATCIIIIAALLLLLVLVTWIAVGVCHARNKKRLAKKQLEINILQDHLKKNESLDGGSTQNTEAVRAEMEQQIRDEVAREYANIQSTDEATAQQVAALSNALEEKNAQIDELTAALSHAATTQSSSNTEIFKTINDLNQTNKDLQSDVTTLREENARLKAQAKYSAAPDAEQKPAAKSTATKSAGAKSTATRSTAAKKAPAAKPAPEPVIEDDDDEDEYYDDYGDATSDVKVTLKYDRIKMNWVISRSDTNRTYRRLNTKQEGLTIAKDLARRLHAQLVVHKKDGKFQKV